MSAAAREGGVAEMGQGENVQTVLSAPLVVLYGAQTREVLLAGFVPSMGTVVQRAPA